MKPTLYLTVRARQGFRGRGAAAAVLRWDGSGEARTVVRRQRTAHGGEGVYRALLFGLWEARRIGARSLIVDVGDAEIAAQIRGTDAPPAEVLSAYLQVRALLNAFRSVVIERPSSTRPDAAAAAAAASAAIAPRRPVYTDLPLWTATAS